MRSFRNSKILNCGVFTYIFQPSVTPRRRFLEQNSLQLLSINKVWDKKLSFQMNPMFLFQKCLFPSLADYMGDSQKCLNKFIQWIVILLYSVPFASPTFLTYI